MALIITGDEKEVLYVNKIRRNQSLSRGETHVSSPNEVNGLHLVGYDTYSEQLGRLSSALLLNRLSLVNRMVLSYNMTMLEQMFHDKPWKRLVSWNMKSCLTHLIAKI